MLIENWDRSIIGGGVFNLMHDMSAGAGAGAIIIGWVITAIGMLMLAKTFQNLTMKRPDLDAGVYSYAEAGFGKYMGFNSAWGYWLSAWLGNVGYATLLMSAVGYFFPVFGDGQNIWSIDQDDWADFISKASAQQLVPVPVSKDSKKLSAFTAQHHLNLGVLG